MQRTRAIINANKAEGVEIYADEQGFYHVLLVRKENNPRTKKYDEYESVVQYNQADFAQMKATDFFNDYDTVEILHDPTLIDDIDPATFYEETAPVKEAVPGTGTPLSVGNTEADVNVTGKDAAAQAKANRDAKKKVDDDAKAAKKQADADAKAAATKAADPKTADGAPAVDLETARAQYQARFQAEAPADATLEELNELIAGG